MDVQKLRDLFEYHDGELYWKSGVHSGKIAGFLRADGRREISVGSKSSGCRFRTLNYRVIFALEHGYLPETVDHIDGDPSNNRIENLRAATQKQQRMNSNAKGLYFDKSRKKWMSYITVNDKMKNLGRFDCFAKALAARRNAASDAFGEFARHRS